MRIAPSPTASSELACEADGLRGLACALVGNAHHADDVVQDVAVAALLAPRPPQGNRAAWLTAVARHVAWKHGRGEARRRRREHAVARPEGSASTLDALVRFEEERRLRDAVARLSEPLRLAVRERYFEGTPPRETARRRGEPVSTVKARLKRALAELRTSLGVEVPEPSTARRCWVVPLGPIVGGTAVTKKLAGLAALLVLGIGSAAYVVDRSGSDSGDPDGRPPPVRTAAPPETAAHGPLLEGTAAKAPGEKPSPSASAPITATSAAPSVQPDAGLLVLPDSPTTEERAAEVARARAVPSAVAASPFGLPPPPPGRSIGPGSPRGPGGGGPTGHWTKYPVDRAPGGRASLEVHVVDAGGRPVEGAEIFLLPADRIGSEAVSFGDVRKVGVTDERGTLVAEALPEGGAGLVANPDRLLNGPAGLDARGARGLALVADQRVRVRVSVPIDLGTLVRVEGVVRDEARRPVASARVVCGYVDTWSDPTGGFVLPRVRATEAVIEVSATGYQATQVQLPRDPGPNVRLEVLLIPAESGSVVLTGSVRGPRGEPVADATIYLLVDGDRGTLRRGRSDASGGVSLAGLPDRLRTAPCRVQADALRLGYPPTQVKLPLGVDGSHVEIRFTARLVSLHVRVLAPDGSALPDCRLTASGRENQVRPQVPLSYRADASAYVGEVESGTQRVRVECLEAEPVEVDVPVTDSGAQVETVVRVNVPMPRPTTVALRVQIVHSQTGAPVGRAKVEVAEKSGGEVVSRLEGARADGVYVLPAPSGARHLLVSAEGFTTEELAVVLPRAPAGFDVEVTLHPR